MEKKETIELNQDFSRILDLMENTKENLFISGRAGTGKSTFIDYFRKRTKKNCVVLAPTGVAALNIKGQTIHSFFGFKPGVTPSSVKPNKKKMDKNIYKEIDIIIVDEISMARADLLDCMDAFLRIVGKDVFEPFGGIQMVFIGDLYQLPPVVTNDEKQFFEKRYKSPFFFDSKVFLNFKFRYIELSEVYRQTENEFIELLEGIRLGEMTDSIIERINQKVNSNLEQFLDNNYIYLSTTNYIAEKINIDRLNLVKGNVEEFIGSVMGDFPIDRLPTQRNLQLKKGAQVMFLNNDNINGWVNGDIGIIEEIIRDDFIEEIVVKIPGKGNKRVKPYRWETVKYILNNKDNKVETKHTGSFFQFPLKLAWAITIHKSQGKTFERVVVDFDRGTFASGQAYVALSRCRTLDGLVLRKPIEKHFAFIDERIADFYKNLNS